MAYLKPLLYFNTFIGLIYTLHEIWTYFEIQRCNKLTTKQSIKRVLAMLQAVIFIAWLSLELRDLYRGQINQSKDLKETNGAAHKHTHKTTPHKHTHKNKHTHKKIVNAKPCLHCKKHNHKNVPPINSLKNRLQYSFVGLSLLRLLLVVVEIPYL